MRAEWRDSILASFQGEVAGPVSLDGAALSERARTWQEFGAGILKKSGVTSALLGGGLAFQEVVMPESRADADMIFTGTDPVPHTVRGAARTVEQGGNSMYTKFNYTFNGQQISGIASGVGFNKNGSGYMLGTSHVDYVRSNLGGTLTFGTGSHAVTNPGNQYTLSQAFTYATYTGPNMWMTQPDFTIFKLDRELVGAGELVFAPSGPNIGDIIRTESYGEMRFSNGAFIAPSGTAQSGVAQVSDINNVGGLFTDKFYFATAFRGSLPGEAAGTDGASNGGKYDQLNNQLLGLTVGGDLNGAGLTISLKTSAPEISSFIQNVTAVPEPSSAILGFVLVAYAATRRFFSKKQS